MSTYEFSVLYTTLPHNLIKEKLKELIARGLFKGTIRHTLPVTKETRSLLLNTNIGINFCYERDVMATLSYNKEAKIIQAFNSTSRYLNDLLNIDNPLFEGMVSRIYPLELQLNKTNASDTEAKVLDLHLFISNGFVSSKIYNRRDVFDFGILNVLFLDGDVPRSTSNTILHFSTYLIC